MGDISGVNDAADAVTKLADGDIDGALLSAALAAPTPFSKAGKMAKEGIESAGESKAKRTVAREAEETAPAARRKPAAGAAPKPKPRSAASPSRWKRSDFEGRRVYQRDDLIDPRRRDHLGRTNVTRMKRGLAPLGPDRKPLNLHHTTQRDDGSLAELAQTFHQRNTKVIHVNTNKIPSGINRREFNRLKGRYWRNRAQGYDGDPFAPGLAPPSLSGSR
ncbi:MAG: HNH/ENDO VII family nuclease [Actinomycetota bacterium]|nr:HNH/ENDO VII family nuclease [Actinomycetota bacterium]